jgi:chromosome segregation ATPase
MRIILASFVCVGLCLGAAKADTPPVIDQVLNDLMALRAKVMIEAHQLRMEVRQAVNDPAHTSPEIAALRKKVEELQEAITRTQGEIREKVEALPAVQEKIKKVEEAGKKVEELTQKIDAKVGAK